MKLRFVTGNDEISAAIRLREGEMARHIGFTPSHVEIVLPEGYLGAHLNGGVRYRKPGYDSKYLEHELFVNINVPDEATAISYAKSKIGTPYDWPAILDFIMPTTLHLDDHVICSAFATLTLQHGGLFILAAPAHAISPRDLLLVLSGITLIGGPNV
jgi:hypothetical protein